jgi:hypothetical protein
MKTILAAFCILLFPMTILGQEHHTFGPTKDGSFSEWYDPNGQGHIYYPSVHNVGIWTTAGYELRTISTWQWSYSDIPTEATVTGVKIRFAAVWRSEYPSNPVFGFSMRKINHINGESGPDFFALCNDPDTIFATPDAGIQPVVGDYGIKYAYFSQWFYPGSRVCDSISNAVRGGGNYLTLGLKIKAYVVNGQGTIFDGFWEIQDSAGATDNTHPAIDLTIQYTTPTQTYQFTNVIQDATDYGHLIIDNDTNNPLASGASCMSSNSSGLISV